MNFIRRLNRAHVEGFLIFLARVFKFGDFFNGMEVQLQNLQKYAC